MEPRKFIPGISTIDWTERRVGEFIKFEQLVRECEMINRTTDWFGTLERIVALAKELNRFDLSSEKPSFVSWLRKHVSERKVTVKI